MANPKLIFTPQARGHIINKFLKSEVSQRSTDLKMFEQKGIYDFLS